MALADPAFIFIALVTAAGALVAVLASSVIHALLGLILAMFGIAGLYIFLNAPFIAMMQILIYVGAISILIAFAIMLAGPFAKKPVEWTTPAKFAGALFTALFSVSVLYFLIRDVFAGGVLNHNITTADLGRVFYDRLLLPFELISLLIVVSIIGAIMLALLSRGER